MVEVGTGQVWQFIITAEKSPIRLIETPSFHHHSTSLKESARPDNEYTSPQLFNIINKHYISFINVHG